MLVVNIVECLIVICWFLINYSIFFVRNRNAFAITETELKLIANAAIIGDNNIPKNGNKTPDAIGTPKVL